MSQYPLLPDVLSAVQQKYHIGPRYARAYLDYWQTTRGRTEESLEAILSRPQPEPLWFEFAMSTNQRAQAFFEAHRHCFSEHHRRYLDVGCGFGGFLVAFANNGFDVCGIELDPERMEFSKANCLDAGLEGVVQLCNILEDGVEQKLGLFDVVTCMDVIEHVLDVPQALTNLRKMLTPGGVLIMEIPNRDSIAFVRKDGHFALFGITCLEREEAIEYHKHCFGFEYDVGHYHEQGFYVAALEAQGLQCYSDTAAGHVLTGRAVEVTGMCGLIADWWRFGRTCARRLPRGLRWRIHRAVGRYATSLLCNAVLMHMRMRTRPEFQRRFLSNFWTLVARNPPREL